MPSRVSCSWQVICINKPAGLLSQGDRTGDVDVAALAREYVRLAANKPGEAFVAVVHRLDRPGKRFLLLLWCPLTRLLVAVWLDVVWSLALVPWCCVSDVEEATFGNIMIVSGARRTKR